MAGRDVVLKRFWIYDSVCVLLVSGGLYLSFRSVEFLAQKDYVSAGVGVLLILFMLRTSVEMGRLSVFLRQGASS